MILGKTQAFTSVPCATFEILALKVLPLPGYFEDSPRASVWVMDIGKIS